MKITSHAFCVFLIVGMWTGTGCNREIQLYLQRVEKQKKQIAILEKEIPQFKLNSITQHEKLAGEITQIRSQTPILKEKLRRLNKEKEELDKQLSQLQSLDEGVEQIYFTSGKTFNGSALNYKNGFLAIKDGNEIEKKGSIKNIRKINFRVKGIEMTPFPTRAAKRQNSTPKTWTPPSPSPININAEPQFKLNITRDKKSRKVDLKEGYEDEIEERIKFLIKLQNNERSKKFEDFSIEMYVFAENVNIKKQLNLIIKNIETFSVSPQEAYKYETPTKTIYHDDIDAKYGFEYYGYIALLKDDMGKVLEIRKSKFRLEKYLDKIVNMNENQLLDM